MTPPPPTGRQHEIRHDEHVVTAVEVGGGLRTYRVGDRAVLFGYGEHELVTGARGQQLTPWPNRLQDGRFEWAGQSLQLPLTEPEKGNAIHGLARWVSWHGVEHSARSVTLAHRIHPQPGWPWCLDVQVSYVLTSRGLLVRTEAHNLSAVPVPFGHGAHPYLTVGTPTVDSASFQLPAHSYLPTDERGLPTGTVPVEEQHDFRTARPLGSVKLDTTFTDLDRDADGRVHAVLSGPDGTRVTLWADRTYPWIEVFTGDTLPSDQRRRGLGVEPMSMPPNGLRTGEGVIVLEPGGRHTGEWGITPG